MAGRTPTNSRMSSRMASASSRARQGECFGQGEHWSLNRSVRSGSDITKSTTTACWVSRSAADRLGNCRSRSRASVR